MQDIESIFRDYNQYVYHFALKLTCHPEDAMDITQETFFKAWKNITHLKKEESLAKWLRSICYREFLMKLRKDKQDELSVTCDLETLEREGELCVNLRPQPEDEVVVAEEIRELQNGCFLAMVRKLSLHQRIAFSLADMFGLSIDEVADILQVTKGAAKGLLYRGRMNIDAFFADHCNLLYENNPCSCEAWIRFSANRAEMQKKVRETNKILDYTQKNYQYNDEVRRKIHYLYQNMTERKPSDEWYTKVIHSLQK